ncbi:MAG TPA: GEGP motif-containing diheme protein, partial [Thermodesulfobacteriota bacterium]|nr:GEGP motif-containing diheme protein [Thermodesulfobacteriota bacterium]
CHQTYGTKAPHTPPVPLNSYGADYKTVGRTTASFQAIQNLDSDGDGKTNLEEIQALTFPGDPRDYPGLVSAPVIALNMERILKLPDYSEFLLLNASKSQDFYATYRGVRAMDLLRYVGVTKEATQITIFAPDGFSQTFPIDASDPQTPSGIQYDVMGPYPNGYYYGELDFVDYAYDPGYPNDNGYKIPDKLYMLLAYLRDGDLLTPGKINATTLKLDGEGPYRLIPPQKIAGGPDRPSTAVPLGDGWDYDANKDHNAGFSARSVAAIRVEPLPSGTTDFNWYEGGWNLVDKARLVIYGAIHPRTYWVWGKVADSAGKPVRDAQISFGLISLGQVGGDTSSLMGIFKKDLPEGEYIAIPSKQGYAFEPESIKFRLSPMGYKMEFTAYPVP